ncbi:2-polyprenyl-3-methyl-5-hydroxy-6-metoxy-1,4-benzoquinol methylase [Gracilibacillus halotolerans]|uniref:2-polyprenyl-3-methyl-5-hydroxy-6-metoxy-1, 4-benzoquinol methylase n=1 Tax=Gracilibacillus halotolerans TaxID=74386 RepID=A0A841RLV1_9BACI|nr:class I SAM-dependent methyltransferase [Gracilibacillus halotolerans]MBB6512135.1 2-polyprenyl-3-methyl-5-hydroxy-6-metoxy-1,4-benzoquinol methylase [Gracilibacillus halotolerans]
MNRLELIRKEEKKYHDYCYENYTLFEEGSWLHKPVKTVMNLLPLFNGKENIRILDLGSGVGRNSIPIAKKIKDRNGQVVCVDLLDSALEKLKLYSKEYEVEEVIKLQQADIGHYKIKKNEYDFIVAVSTLEHVESEDVFEDVVRQMAQGTKSKGINCIIVNSEVEEIDIKTNQKLDVMMEINMKTEDMKNKLDRIYDGWEKLDNHVKSLEYSIVRDEKDVLLKTNAITYVVRKNDS